MHVVFTTIFSLALILLVVAVILWVGMLVLGTILIVLNFMFWILVSTLKLVNLFFKLTWLDGLVSLYERYTEFTFDYIDRIEPMDDIY